MATAVSDGNGFIEIRDNKLSKPGVFGYLGSEIGAPDPGKVYQVFRPPEELRDPACAESFKLQPWVIDHQMLGKNYGTSAEDKGIHGVIGQDVYFDESDGWLKGNIKIFSDTLENVIAEGKDELSLGFGCTYEFGHSGSYDGQDYEVLQKDIRGNHLASVGASRMNVAVMDHGSGMDHMTVTINKAGVFPMSTKEEGQGEGTKVGTGEDNAGTLTAVEARLTEVLTTVSGLAKRVSAMDEDMKKRAMDMDKDDDDDDEGMDMDKDKKGMDKDKMKDGGMDAAIEKAVTAALKPVSDELRLLKTQGFATDTASLMAEISKRDALANQLVRHVGAFDHEVKSLEEVAKYGVDKLSIPCDEGSEVAAVTAYLHNRPATGPLYTSPTGEDGAPVVSPVNAYLNGGAK